MTMWALCGPDNVVVQIDDTDPAGRYHADLVWHPCPPETAVGDVFAAGAFVRPAPPAATLAGRLAALAAERYARETAGVSFQASGAAAASLAASDAVSQSKMTSSYVAALGGHWVDGTPWKMLDGSFVRLTSDDMKTMALTLLGYIAQCYAREAELAALLDADLTTDITQGWPANGPAVAVAAPAS